MTLEMISKIALDIRRRYDETDPFRLCEAMNVRVLQQPMGQDAKACKGFFMIISRVPLIMINSDLSEQLQKIVLLHEIGHAVLHRSRAAAGFHDFDLFGIADQCEYEANVFAAEYFLQDDDVMTLLNEDMTFFGAAKTLNVPPELLDFKFRVMKQRGYAVTPPMLASGDFMRRLSDRRS